MNTYIPSIIQISKSDVFRIPDRCLQTTIKNDGGSLVFIDNAIRLEPGDSYPIPHIPGMYLVGNIKVQVHETTGVYTNETLVTFRNQIQNI